MEKKYCCTHFRGRGDNSYCAMNQGCVPNDDKTDCKRIGCPIRINELIS